MNELIFQSVILGAIQMQSGIVVKTLVILFLLAIAWWGIGKLGMTGFPLQVMQVVIGITCLAVLLWFVCAIFGVSLP